MKTHVQLALVIVMILYLLWGLGLLVAPELAHALLSTGPYDATSTALFTAGLFAFVLVFMVAAHEPTRELVHVSATGLLFFGLTAAYLMFVNNSMPQHPGTVFSLIINLGAAGYLLMTLTDFTMRLAATPRKRASKKAKKRKARPKTIKRRR
jgi:hypothetical protein